MKGTFIQNIIQLEITLSENPRVINEALALSALNIQNLWKIGLINFTNFPLNFDFKQFHKVGAITQIITK